MRKQSRGGKFNLRQYNKKVVVTIRVHYKKQKTGGVIVVVNFDLIKQKKNKNDR